MKPWHLLVLLAGSLGLVGYTAHLLRGDRPAAREPAAAAGTQPHATAPTDTRGRARFGGDDGARDALAIALASRLERALEAPEEEPLLPTPESRVEAETSFEVVMDRIDGLADSGERVSKRRRQRLYRAANDAFSAFSEHLDPGSARDMATLEEAHVRLKLMLGEIGAGPPGSS